VLQLQPLDSCKVKQIEGNSSSKEEFKAKWSQTNPDGRRQPATKIRFVSNLSDWKLLQDGRRVPKLGLERSLGLASITRATTLR